MIMLRSASLAAVVLVAMACDPGPPPEATPPDADPEPLVDLGRAPADTPEYESPAARTIWERARARGVDFRALGQEPGWTLEIFEGDRIVFVADYGERRVEVPAPPPETPGPDGRTYYRIRTDAHTVDVVIEPGHCEDVMSGEPFPAAVTVNVDGRVYGGCGRALR